jgi:hypothetical protein
MTYLVTGTDATGQRSVLSFIDDSPKAAMEAAVMKMCLGWTNVKISESTGVSHTVSDFGRLYLEGSDA